MMGAGKYDEACTAARAATGAKNAVVLIVLGGSAGDGFSVQCAVDYVLDLPAVLERLARDLRHDTEPPRRSAS
jgi:hypothetical protein